MPKKAKTALTLPDAMENKMNQIIENIFEIFAKHTKSIADDLAEFNAKRAKTRKEIERGTRRTTGRIV